MRPSSSLPLLLIPLLLATAPAQIPTDDPEEAQLEWYEREKERPDLIKGAFEVLRFPTGYTFEPRYERDPRSKGKRLVTNPDFWCTQCARERRLPPERARNPGTLMDQEQDLVLEYLKEELDPSRRATLIEDGQFKLYCDLPPINLKKHPTQFLKQELAELGDIFPEISEKTVVLDGHQRAHLVLIRMHRLLRDFWWLVGTTPEAFAEKYEYLGPYLGMKGKQEVFVFPRQRHYLQFVNDFIGRPSPDGQCWHLFQSRAMVLAMHAERYEDPQLMNFLSHRLLHNLIDAYRMYSFKLPAWFQMGMGHWVERRETIRYNSFCYSEGALPRVLYRTEWPPRIKKLLAKGDVRPFAEVCGFDEYGNFEPEEHMIVWSYVCYLFRLGPEKMPAFINALKDKPEGESLYQSQVRAFRSVYGISVLQFEEGWKEWVRAVYPDL